MQGGQAHVDTSARKVCIAALGKLLTSCQDRAGFKQFAMEQIGVRCCLCGLCNGSVDARDGGAVGLLNEAASALSALQATYGQDFQALAAQCTHSSSEQDVAEQWAAVLASVSEQDARRIKDALKALMRAKQGLGARVLRQPTADS